MSVRGRPANGDAEFGENVRLFVRRENTYHLLLILLKQRALKRSDYETAVLIDQVIARANEGDGVKLDLMALYTQED